MTTLKAIQTSVPPTNQLLPRHGKFTSKKKWTICFCNSDGSGSDSSSSSPSPEGDKRQQELLVKIAMLQAQKVRLTNYLDERSASLTQFAEDANAEFDEIGENALKELDDAGDRIMEKLDSQMEAFEETAEINRQEIAKNEKVLEEFEEKIESDRNEGLFFKNLGKKKAPDQRNILEAKAEAQKLKEITRQGAGSKTRRNVYLGLMALLAITIGNAVFASPEVEWKKVAALGLIFLGLLAQFVYELSLSSTGNGTSDNKDE